MILAPSKVPVCLLLDLPNDIISTLFPDLMIPRVYAASLPSIPPISAGGSKVTSIRFKVGSTPQGPLDITGASYRDADGPPPNTARLELGAHYRFEFTRSLDSVVLESLVQE